MAAHAERRESRILESLKRYVDIPEDKVNEIIKCLEAEFSIPHEIPQVTESGVYLIHLHKAIFEYDSGEGFVRDPDFALIKIGRADDLRNRYGQFGFHFRRVFEVNGPNDMEKKLKALFVSNFKTTFFKPKTKVPSIKKEIGIAQTQNPGPSEWRIISTSLLNDISKLVLNPGTCVQQLTDLVSYADQWKFEPNTVKMVIGNLERTNLTKLVVPYSATDPEYDQEHVEYQIRYLDDPPAQ